MNALKLGTDTFTVNALLAEESFDLQPKLLPVLPDMLELAAMFTREFFELVEAKGGDANVDVPIEEILDKGLGLLGRASPIISRVCAKLNPDEMRYIRRTLLSGATCNGKPLYGKPGEGNLIDVVLQGRTIDLWRLLIFAVEVSYPDFFALLAALKKKAPKADEPSEK